MLEDYRTLHWLGADLESLRTAGVPPGSARLAAHGDAGVAVGPVTVRDIVAAKLIAGSGFQLAVSVTDHLVVLDGLTGAVLLRAKVPMVGGLAAADLDQDGRAELILAAGRRVAVLKIDKP